MAARIVPECSIQKADNKLISIYNDCNIWFGIKTEDSNKINVINRIFYKTKGIETSTNNSDNVREIIGQFITSMWFSKEISIKNSIKFYVVTAYKKYSHDNVVEFINSINDRENKFYTYDSFSLPSAHLYNAFDKMFITNNDSMRINLYSKHNPEHTLSIHMSIKHLSSKNESNKVRINDNFGKETIIIDTPTITYS